MRNGEVSFEIVMPVLVVNGEPSRAVFCQEAIVSTISSNFLVMLSLSADERGCFRSKLAADLLLYRSLRRRGHI
jgi:hypothetical protein